MLSTFLALIRYWNLDFFIVSSIFNYSFIHHSHSLEPVKRSLLQNETKGRSVHTSPCCHADGGQCLCARLSRVYSSKTLFPWRNLGKCAAWYSRFHFHIKWTLFHIQKHGQLNFILTLSRTAAISTLFHIWSNFAYHITPSHSRALVTQEYACTHPTLRTSRLIGLLRPLNEDHLLLPWISKSWLKKSRAVSPGATTEPTRAIENTYILSIHLPVSRLNPLTSRFPWIRHPVSYQKRSTATFISNFTFFSSPTTSKTLPLNDTDVEDLVLKPSLLISPLFHSYILIRNTRNRQQPQFPD